MRYRHTDSDLYRVARQQQFVKAAKQQVNQFSIFKLPRLIGAVVHNTQIAEAGAKGIDVGTLRKYANFLYALPPGHFFQPKIENLTETGLDNAELAGSPEDIQKAVTEFLHPDVSASSTATNVALGRKPKRKPGLRPSQVTVSVLNGNGVTGSATNAAYLLRQRGYQIVLPADQKPANAPTWNYFHTKVYYQPGVAGAKGAAKVIAKAFGAADVQQLPPSLETLSNGARRDRRRRADLPRRPRARRRRPDAEAAGADGGQEPGPDAPAAPHAPPPRPVPAAGAVGDRQPLDAHLATSRFARTS